MKLDVSGKRIVITGASSGLGEHFGRVLSHAGASLGLLARRRDRLDSLALELKSTSENRISVAGCNVLDPAAVNRAINDLRAELGGIDVLINNAGVTHQAPALEQTLESWDAVLNTNLRGAWLVAAAVAKVMVSDDIPGHIINIASVLGLRAASQIAPYAISKAGVVHMTKVLALELARHKIRVNALAPGYIRTDLNADFFESEAGKALLSRVPQRRLGEPAELDGPLILLASDAASFMTGAVIPVDGGHLVSSL